MLRVRARDNSLLRRALQRGRRPGRADLRRPLGRARRRGRGDRARARLRGGAARRRHRPGRRRRPPAPRRAPPRARAGAARARRRRSARARDAARPARPVPARAGRAARRPRADAQALELGLRDYVDKNGFGDVVIGLSGGIDSALTAALAVEALGAERVHGVSMPSRYSSEATRADAQRLAESLGIDFGELAIEPVVEAFTAVLAPSFAGREPDLTEENLQARDPRHAADGALEQVRLARDRDRQQVRAVGRLLDALRRPRRRLRAAQGRLQDGRVPPRAPAERARRPRADPAVDHRARAERRAARRPARRGLAAAVREARPGARGLRRARPLARGALPGRLRRRTSSTARSR